MYKSISKIFILSALLWFTSSFADDESPLVDLHRGTLVMPCVYVLVDGEANPIAVNVRMNQRGNSVNWEIVSASSEGTDACSEYIPPIITEAVLAVTPEEDSKCERANSNANNCGTKSEDEDDEEAGKVEKDIEDDCERANDNANNCGDKEKHDGRDDDGEEDDEENDS